MHLPKSNKKGIAGIKEVVQIIAFIGILIAVGLAIRMIVLNASG